jgi:hypothetical protein
VGRHGITVRELPEIGRQRAAVLKADATLLVDSRDRDDLSVRYVKSRCVAISGKELLVPDRYLNHAAFINVEGLCLLTRNNSLFASTVPRDNTSLFHSDHVQNFVFRDSVDGSVKP